MPLMKSVLTCLFLLCVSIIVHAETNKCTTIKSLPYTINLPGIYCLKKDLVYTLNGLPITTGNAITINAENVTIDLNRHILDGTSVVQPSNATGIYSNNHKNIVIKNGVIQGFWRGIVIEGSTSLNAKNAIIEDISTADISFIAILATSDYAVIRNNNIESSGAVSGDIYGIFSTGSNTKILNNNISGLNTTSPSSAYGIFVEQGGHNIIKGNNISSIYTQLIINSYGIHCSGSTSDMVTDNRIVYTDNGIKMHATTYYMNNFVGDSATPYSGGISAGSTNF